MIPKGVGAPPPPGMDPRKGKLMCIKVRMLDDTVGVFHLGVSFPFITILFFHFFCFVVFLQKFLIQLYLFAVCQQWSPQWSTAAAAVGKSSKKQFNMLCRLKKKK